jgi:hypothetical protein
LKWREAAPRIDLLLQGNVSNHEQVD